MFNSFLRWFLSVFSEGTTCPEARSSTGKREEDHFCSHVNGCQLLCLPSLSTSLYSLEKYTWKGLSRKSLPNPKKLQGDETKDTIKQTEIVVCYWTSWAASTNVSNP